MHLEPVLEQEREGGSGGAGGRRAGTRKLSTTSSSSWQMRDTRRFEMPSHPNALTRSSTRLVDTPFT